MKTLEDSASYAWGLQTAKNLQQQDLFLNPSFVEKGFLDADTTKGKPLFTEEQLRGIERRLQERMLAKISEKNKIQGEKFLAQNKTKPGVVTLPNGLQYQVVKPGNGPKPQMGYIAFVNLIVSTVDGRMIENTAHAGQPIALPVGTMQGYMWTGALALMPTGSTWRFFVPSELAFGADPRSPAGPNAVLVFEVELVNSRPAPTKK